MLRACDRCGQRFESPMLSDHRMCAACVDSASETDWVSVARVSSLAEVGYFEDLLGRQQIEAQVHQREDFDAVAGLWHPTFVVQVPRPRAETAIALMQQELATDSALHANDGETVWSTLQRSAWFMLLASGLVYFAGRTMMHGAPAADPPVRAIDEAGPASLWEALMETDSLWVSPGQNGQPARQLRYDTQQRLLWLEEDTNGDGEVDRHRVFQNGVLLGEEQR